MNDYINPIQRSTQPAENFRPGGAGRRIVTPRLSGGMGRMLDYTNPFAHTTSPASSLVQPPGPSDTPIQKATPQPATLNDLLQQMRQNNDPQRAIFRGLVLGAGGNGTLDWSMLGLMTRIVIRNKGPNSVFFAFDISGPQINTFTSDNSWELQANESFNGDTIFYKIGLRCKAGETAVINAAAWPFPSVGQSIAV
jgi:hypothetical protein